MGPRDPRDTGNASGVKLFRTLIEPAQALIPAASRVIVVGSGALNTLNFDTLLVPQPQLHYWIEDAVISYASAISLVSGSNRTPPGQQRELLLIGNPVYAGSPYPELKQAKLEVQEVAQHFSPWQRMLLEGPAATPSAYSASNAGQFAYIHFVAHGTASQISPLDSSIILSQQNDRSKLYARDIMTQSLHAKLVTISACYGAGTRSFSGEGLVGLSWAFLRAGAHNVVAALWEVSDNSTPELMDAMYAKLQQGRDPAVALRDAQLAMLHSGSVYRRPFYWGAFQVYSGRQ
jgi:CHAT domain-containing protein